MAQKQEAFPKPSREPVLWLPPGRLSTLGETSGTVGKDPLATSQQETLDPTFSQTFSSEEGKVHGAAAVSPPERAGSIPIT